MSTLGQDLRYALRMLRRSPGFAAVAIGTLALGIGANTAIFSVVHAMLLKPLPYPEPGQLVRVTADFTKTNGLDMGLSAPELFDYRERAGVFSAMSGLFPINANVTGGDRPERVEVLLTDTNYFQILGTKPQVGRLYDDRDYDPGIADLVVLSDGFWRRRYGADPNVIGKPLRIDDDLCTIVGVLPPGFRHPGRNIETDVEIWVPSGWLDKPFRGPNRKAYFLQGAIARLKPGVTPETAQQRLDALGADLRREYPSDYPTTDGWSPRLEPLQEDLVGAVRRPLFVLLGAVGLVLLIACANIANLLLARASARRREIAVRQALGAGRARLIRQLLTESLVIALAGGVLGLLLARGGLDLLVRFLPVGMPRLPEIALDARVLAFALAASVVTGLLFGLVPALQTSEPAVGSALDEGARGASGRRGKRIRSVLVVAEFALAVVLLVGAGLLIRTFWRLHRVATGFDARQVTTASLWLPQPDIREQGRYNETHQQAALYTKVLDRLRSVPGVAQAAGATRVPFGNGVWTNKYFIEGRDPEQGGIAIAEASSATSGYFETLRIPLKRGRAFTDNDAEEAMPVLIVNETFARTFFPGEDALGRRMRNNRRNPEGQIEPGPWMTIVGVVGDTRQRSLLSDPPPMVYRPMLQAPSADFTFLIRGPAPAAELASRIDDEVRAVDPELPIYAVRSLESSIAASVAERRFVMRLLGLFALAALLLAAIGVYGVIAYSVVQRTREIGIRMALGARPGDVQRMLLVEGGRLAALGVAVGVAGALLLTGAMSALLYGVGPRDLLTFAAVPALLASVALAACFFPALRASRLDPTTALRSE
jgi:predicted permease